ncbi:MAG TPA: hypothetical protein VFL15_05685 [Gammaproteobacteria bacterium]|nr:hypothetical protein [Gammaproteobacteria bacterium]
MNALTGVEGMLTHDEYQLLAAVPLQAAAEVAAQRGDPQLFNDMAAMLALLAMVTTLTHAYLNRQPVFRERSPVSVLEAVPIAVCALVFSESNLEPREVQTCLRSLSSAYFQLLREGTLGPQDAYVEKAFEMLLAGDRVQALQGLKRGAVAMAHAVDAWEAGRRELD